MNIKETDPKAKTPPTFADISGELSQAGWRLSATPYRGGKVDGDFTASKGQPQNFKLVVTNINAPSEKMQLGSDQEFPGAEKVDPAKVKPEDPIQSGYVKKDISVEEAVKLLEPPKEAASK